MEEAQPELMEGAIMTDFEHLIRGRLTGFALVILLARSEQ